MKMKIGGNSAYIEFRLGDTSLRLFDTDEVKVKYKSEEWKDLNYANMQALSVQYPSLLEDEAYIKNNKVTDVIVELEYRKLFKAIEGRFYNIVGEDFIPIMVKTDIVRLEILLNTNIVASVNDKIGKLNFLNKGGWELSSVKFNSLYKQQNNKHEF